MCNFLRQHKNEVIFKSRLSSISLVRPSNSSVHQQILVHKSLRNRSCFKIFVNLFIGYRFKVKFQPGSRKWTHDKKC